MRSGGGGRVQAWVYVRRGRRSVSSRGRKVWRSGRPAPDGTGRFLLGPLQSGVLQQVMHTELRRPVQNCWYPEEAMRQAPEEAHDFL